MQTKLHLLALLCIASLASCGDQSEPKDLTDNSASKPVDSTNGCRMNYVASIPPGSNKNDHIKLRNEIKKWVNDNKVLTFDEKRDAFYHEDKKNPHNPSKEKQSRGHLFRLNLTKNEAISFQKEFQTKVFFGRDDIFEFHQDVAEEYEDDGPHSGGNASIRMTWPQDAMIPSHGIVNKDTATDHTPVIYIVDTGVQWIINSAGARHQQFSDARIGFKNGRVPPSVGVWPPPNQAPYQQAPWNTLDADIPNYPTVTQPYSKGGNYLDPNKDPLVHGTKVASVAVGCYASNPSGVYGKIATVTGSTTTVKVQSIRVFPANGNPATSLNITDGIYEAIDAHLWRDSTGAARSVLVLPNRSTLGFSENVEVALLHAWRQGMIVICSGGNSAATYDTNLGSPNSLWYDSNYQIDPALPQPTCPSRFDVDLATTYSTSWPPHTDDQGHAILAPTRNDRCYAILVGGNNTSAGFITGAAYTDNWAPATSTAKGPDIDIVVPVKSMPCATISSTTSMANTAGTSFSAGLAAGIAAVFLDHNDSSKTPQHFRDWLLPINKGPINSMSNQHTPFQNTTSCDSWYNAANSSSDNSWYRMEPFYSHTGNTGNVMKLLITSDTDWSP